MNPLVSALSDILPLLVGSGVAIAFVHLVVKQSEPERVPPLARYFNVWGATVATLVIVLASFAALYHVGFFTTTILDLIWISYSLLFSGFVLLIIAFLIPAVINAIPYLWAKTFYPQFEEAQSKDVEEAKEAKYKKEAEETKTE